MSAASWPNGTRDRKPRRTREFGFRSAIYSRGYHTGWDTVDYNINCSPADGVVVWRGYDGSYGNSIIVEHAGGVRSRTAHGSQFLKNVGDPVKSGEGLLVQASTGMSTGKHNHQEIILPDGTFVDPEKWIQERLNNQGGGGSPAPQPSGGQKIDLRQGWAWYTSAANAVNERNPRGPKWTGEQLARGIYNVLSANEGGAIKVRAFDGSTIFISPKARHLISGSAPQPAPQPNRGTTAFVDLKTEWYWYDSLENARAARNARGLIPRGKHRIDGGSGPYLVYVGALNRQVWVGSRTLPAVVHIPN